ncbi:DNA-binding Xre family transcriptional regulator [Lachnospiraceae bacterium PF1-22]
MLSDILVNQGKTQLQLEQMTGIRPQTVVELYHNKYKCLTINVMEKICFALRVYPGDLFSLDSNKAYTRKRSISENMEIRCHLGELIEKKGYSIPQFAKKTNVRENSLRNMIKNKALRIQKDNIDAMCRELGVSFGEVYTLTRIKKD